MDKHQFYTVITSKGTTTIPSRIRRELGLMPGDTIEFNTDPISGSVVISRVPTLAEIRKRNAKYIKNRRPLTDREMDKIVERQIIKQYKEKERWSK